MRHAGLITLQTAHLLVVQYCAPELYRAVGLRDLDFNGTPLTEMIIEGPMMPDWTHLSMRPDRVSAIITPRADDDGWRVDLSLQVRPTLEIIWRSAARWPTKDAMMTDLHLDPLAFT